jgi:hypothetical protein
VVMSIVPIHRSRRTRTVAPFLVISSALGTFIVLAFVRVRFRISIGLAAPAPSAAAAVLLVPALLAPPSNMLIPLWHELFE